MTDGLHAAPLSTVARRDGEAVRIAVAGEIDLGTSPRLRSAVLAAIDAPSPPGEVKIDLSSVTFMDASGVAALLAGREAARRRGVGFQVLNPHGIVLRVLDILGLYDTLNLAKVRR